VGVSTPSGGGFDLLRDFESGAVGTSCNRKSDGFSDLAGAAVYSTEQALGGTQCAKLTVQSGAEGFGQWGGAVTFPQNVGQGGHLWVQLKIYIPASFIIDTPSNGSLKYIRIRQATSVGGNAGFFDLQMQDDDKAAGEGDFRMLKEGQAVWQNFGADGTLTRDTVLTHTLHMVMDATLPASGGTSRIRFWQGNTKLVDSGTIKTLINATDYADALYLFTYWNGTAPQTQSLYVDDIRISSDASPSWAAGLS
jgi:hypothetical protein